MSAIINAGNETEPRACSGQQRRRFTVDEFQRMGEAGIFAPDERVELIEGDVLIMSPIGARHMEGVFAAEDLLRPLISSEMRMSIQGAIQLARSEPIPDLALFRRGELKPGRVPPASACALVVEVADSTVRLDRKRKRRSYAAAEIPEYWVVDLPAGAVAVHLVPVEGRYANVADYARGTSFISPALGGATIRVDDLLRSPYGA